jgi:outer membrane murein-binding lipoprotein Lpp
MPISEEANSRISVLESNQRESSEDVRQLTTDVRELTKAVSGLSQSVAVLAERVSIVGPAYQKVLLDLETMTRNNATLNLQVATLTEKLLAISAQVSSSTSGSSVKYGAAGAGGGSVAFGIYELAKLFFGRGGG